MGGGDGDGDGGGDDGGDGGYHRSGSYGHTGGSGGAMAMGSGDAASGAGAADGGAPAGSGDGLGFGDGDGLGSATYRAIGIGGCGGHGGDGGGDAGGLGGGSGSGSGDGDTSMSGGGGGKGAIGGHRARAGVTPPAAPPRARATATPSGVGDDFSFNICAKRLRRPMRRRRPTLGCCSTGWPPVIASAHEPSTRRVSDAPGGAGGGTLARVVDGTVGVGASGTGEANGSWKVGGPLCGLGGPCSPTYEGRTTRSPAMGGSSSNRRCAR